MDMYRCDDASGRGNVCARATDAWICTSATERVMTRWAMCLRGRRLDRSADTQGERSRRWLWTQGLADARDWRVRVTSTRARGAGMKRR